MSNCVDQALIELIARNAILKMLADHTLQAGLRDCDCGWLGHETTVLTCAALDTKIAEMVADGTISRITGVTFDAVTNEIVVTTEAQEFRAGLQPLLDSVADDLASAVSALQAQINAERTQSLTIDAFGQLVLTRGNGTTTAVDLETFLQSQVNEVLNEFWPCGPLQRVHYGDAPFTGQGTSCDPLGLDCEELAECVGEALADQIASAPPTNEGPALPTTVYGARVALLGQPDGWLDIGGRKIPFWS